MFRFVPARCVIENFKKITKKFKKLENTIKNSFQAKIGWKRMRDMENKNYHFVSFLPDEQKKIPKKIEKLKKTIVDSFQAKIDWRRMRKRENTNYTSVTFLSDT